METFKKTGPLGEKSLLPVIIEQNDIKAEKPTAEVQDSEGLLTSLREKQQLYRILVEEGLISEPRNAVIQDQLKEAIQILKSLEGGSHGI